jgi:hypothetical protein
MGKEKVYLRSLIVWSSYKIILYQKTRYIVFFNL